MTYKIIAGVVLGGIVGGLISRFGKCAGGACPLTTNPVAAIVIWAIIGGLLASSLSARPKPPSPAGPGRSTNDAAAGGNMIEKK